MPRPRADLQFKQKISSTHRLYDGININAFPDAL